ncbi:synaptonemal complex protein 3-like [Meriones unguiculatus]|uniref:synaptonemal complex protein 3-like n=1 Tax=Meriones unguiculatus TaxID=10047 RepID=UPI00293ECD18|nr:synaptonemal complex protein 3-like [Meriones unguiculatus]
MGGYEGKTRKTSASYYAARAHTPPVTKRNQVCKENTKHACALHSATQQGGWLIPAFLSFDQVSILLETLPENERYTVLRSTEKSLVPPRSDGDTGYEVKNKLEKIGAQLSSVVVENKTRMQSYVKSVVKDCNRNIKEHWKVHQEEMREFKIEYTEQTISVFKQWDSDIKQVEDQENELTGIFNQQQKTFQQARMLQTDSLKALKQADDEFLKDLEDLENYSSVLKSIRNEFKKQKTLLQRNITDG